MSDIRVTLVHKYELARRGLRRMLEEHEGIEVVGEAGNTIEALRQVELDSPDVVLIDAELPQISGLETTRLLKERGLPGAVVVLSLDARKLIDAMHMGATAYVVENTEADELASVIRRVPDGGFVIGASLMNTVTGQASVFQYLRTLEPQQDSPPQAEGGVTNGSPKERDDDGNDDPPGQQLAKPDLTKEERSLVKIPTNEASIAAPDAPNADLRTEVCPVTEAASVLVGDVVLVLSAPLEPCRLIKLHRWLREVVRADVGETAGSWSKDTVLKITLRRPTPLLKMLNESPDIKRGGLVCLNSAARFDKWNHAAVR